MFWIGVFGAMALVAVVSFFAGMWIGRAGLTDAEIAEARRLRVISKASNVLPHAEDL